MYEIHYLNSLLHFSFANTRDIPVTHAENKYGIVRSYVHFWVCFLQCAKILAVHAQWSFATVALATFARRPMLMYRNVHCSTCLPSCYALIFDFDALMRISLTLESSGMNKKKKNEKKHSTRVDALFEC